MPELDGVETCRRLKEDETTAQIPIISLTAKVETEDVVHGFGPGAVDYVTKPFNPTELLVRVDTHLTLHRLKRDLEQLSKERTKDLQFAHAQLQQYVKELEVRDRLDSVADEESHFRRGPRTYSDGRQPCLCFNNDNDLHNGPRRGFADFRGHLE